jgi:segregation and condensation protein B
MSSEQKLKQIAEAALMAAGKPLSLDELLELFEEEERPERKVMRAAVKALAEEYEDRGVELNEVASGFRIQVRTELAPWVSRLWVERPPRYSRALMETLALIAYRQPITRGEIEDIRGVSVSSNIVKTLLEREWVRVVGQRDVPGRPSLYATTREFLDYFDLKSLEELPTLAEIRDLDSINRELNLEVPGIPTASEGEESPATETEIEAVEDAALEDGGGSEVSASEEQPDEEQTALETGVEIDGEAEEASTHV